jgi:Predicted metal-dependent hydrolase of the TIM-barrel fold
MFQYSQLYTDLGVVLWVHEHTMDYAEQFLRKAKKYELVDRVMFGSDQMVWPHAIEKSINQLNSYDFLTEEDKKIFYDNAVKFLKLKE